MVGQENQIEDVRFLFSPLTTPLVVAAKTRIQRCLCRDVDEIWQCRTGRNLTTFNKDHGTAEKGLQKQSSYSQAYGFATTTTYSQKRDQLPPPLEKKVDFATVRGSPNRHQLYIHSNCSETVCLAARALLLVDLRLAVLRSVVIFVKYREASTRTILLNFIGNCRGSVVFVFWRPQRRHR